MDRHEICTQILCGVKVKNLLSKIFLPDLQKNLAGKNLQIIQDRRQSEARNFEMAKHINKRISDVSSTINALQNSTKLGANHSKGFYAN